MGAKLFGIDPTITARTTGTNCTTSTSNLKPKNNVRALLEAPVEVSNEGPPALKLVVRE